jgi:hypothetical protein
MSWSKQPFAGGEWLYLGQSPEIKTAYRAIVYVLQIPMQSSGF